MSTSSKTSKQTFDTNTLTRKVKDITGTTKGRLTAIQCVGRDKWSNAMWAFSCACDGKIIETRGSGFLSGRPVSCGCVKRERCLRGANSPHFKHGNAGSRDGRCKRSPEYESWKAMVARCTNTKHTGHAYYVDAGVKVCDHWRDFRNFLADMKKRPDNTSLGRFGDVGNYSCGHCEQCLSNGWELNCAWQTRKEQGAEHHLKYQSQLQAA